MTETYQFYHSQPTATTLHDLTTRALCHDAHFKEACIQRFDSLDGSDYIDIDILGASHEVVVSAFRKRQVWSEKVERIDGIKTEVGVLAPQTSVDVWKQTFQGVLVTLGDKEELSEFQIQCISCQAKLSRTYPPFVPYTSPLSFRHWPGHLQCVLRSTDRPPPHASHRDLGVTCPATGWRVCFACLHDAAVLSFH